MKNKVSEWHEESKKRIAEAEQERMQAYADQQVNKKLDEALLICYKHDGIDNWLELRQKLEKLKIKQP